MNSNKKNIIIIIIDGESSFALTCFFLTFQLFMWCIFPKLKDTLAPTRAFNKEMVLSLVYLLINNVAQGASRDESPDSPEG